MNTPAAARSWGDAEHPFTVVYNDDTDDYAAWAGNRLLGRYKPDPERRAGIVTVFDADQKTHRDLKATTLEQAVSLASGLQFDPASPSPREFFVQVKLDTGEMVRGRVDTKRRCHWDLELSKNGIPATLQQAAYRVKTHQEPEPAAPPTSPPMPTPIPSSNPVQLIPWKHLHASPLNPRKSFDPAKLEELAASILERGVLQNLVARHVDGTLFEIAAGERRYRAVGLLVERGQLPDTYALPVSVQPLTDLELATLATTENTQRQDMNPLEEAEGYAQLLDLGADVESIALKLGKSLETVRKRIKLARNLHPEVKAMLATGDLTLAAAQAFTLGTLERQLEYLKKNTGKDGRVLEYARNPNNIKLGLTNSSFYTKHARFDLADYTGNILEDLFGDHPATFVDSAQAMKLQREWVEAHAQSLRSPKRTVVIVDKEGYFDPAYEYMMPDRKSYGQVEPEKATHTFIQFDPRHGEVKEYPNYARRTAKATEGYKPAPVDFTLDALETRLQSLVPYVEVRGTIKAHASMCDTKLQVAADVLADQVRHLLVLRAFSGSGVLIKQRIFCTELQFYLTRDADEFNFCHEDELTPKNLRQFTTYGNSLETALMDMLDGEEVDTLPEMAAVLTRVADLISKPPRWLLEHMKGDTGSDASPDEGDEDEEDA